MNPQIIIQSLLILAVAAVGWMMLRTPGGARNQAARRLVTLAFVLFAVAAIVTPSLMTRVANMVGVGRGTDLLLYALVVAFLAQVLSAFRRNAARERQITRLARRIALDQAPQPPGTTSISPGVDPGAAPRSPTHDT
ncbi:DUF2304 domain-containing protein [Actinomyces lilanjuaniae]|uniref:DUF2304 domain-containing protein n=1 Tax=Actinomyces lilanjuaniae TaxID=2321394 RepID=A0ABM6Z555_9ACTO|nr:DUF2304 domain-containing protein [Actinomyces lilanjuaniae]AYD90273.1 DUF2304 domain-containing protein [Actinomyces lilanjuaniae]